MARACTTCQHLKRPEIDRRLAAGEPAAQVARDYEINPSSLHRHRVNCLNLGSANVIKKEAARGSAAVALLPSKETLSAAFSDLAGQIDGIIAQAKADGSFKLALSGLIRCGRRWKAIPGSPATSVQLERKSMSPSRTT